MVAGMPFHRQSTLIVFFLLLVLSVWIGCSSQQAKSDADSSMVENDLKTLADMMSGVYSSAEQAEVDPDNFHDIRLVMLPIWTTRSNGYWLYVEQALAERVDVPYRQRVYHVYAREDGALISEVFELPGDPMRFAGARRDLSRLSGLTPDSLVLREGCAIVLHKQDDGSFVGGTAGTGCVSRLPGASYATSEVTITDSMLVSWDRGYNDEGEQVWGAVTGGYRFEKLAE